MDQFENDLREAMRQVDPPSGFEQRVLARLALESAGAAGRPRQHRFTAWATAAGMAIASFGGLALYQQQQQQHRAEQAHEQLVLALRVTSQKLDIVRNRMNSPSTSETR